MVEISKKNKVFGVHISIERTIYAIVNIRGDIIARDEFPTTDYPNINDFVSVLSERLVEMMLSNDCLESIRSVGISVSNANPVTNCIENAVNLPWKGVVPLAAMIRDRVGLAVALANKPHARAMGEFVFGSAHGMRNFVLISMGHGMGSCIFSNGRPYLGTDGYPARWVIRCFTSMAVAATVATRAVWSAMWQRGASCRQPVKSWLRAVSPA